ncbi:hypothetical protein C4K68_26570, partial [Pokkaliibacter plantistimulans]
PTADSVSNQSAVQNQAFSFTLPAGTFADVDAGDSLTLTATLANGAALPGWLSFDASTGLFSGTPAAANVGSLSITVTATDADGAQATTTFTLTVARATSTGGDPEFRT